MFIKKSKRVYRKSIDKNEKKWYNKYIKKNHKN